MSTTMHLPTVSQYLQELESYCSDPLNFRPDAFTFLPDNVRETIRHNEEYVEEILRTIDQQNEEDGDIFCDDFGQDSNDDM